jgi:hypothetical protein
MLGKLYEWYAARYMPRFKIFREAKVLYNHYMDTQNISFYKRTDEIRSFAARDAYLMEAEKKYKKAIQLSEIETVLSDVAIGKYQLGMLYHLQGKFDEAMNELNSSTDILESLPQINKELRQTLSGCYYHLGIIEMIKGSNENARKHLINARSIDEVIGDYRGVALEDEVLKCLEGNL